MRRRLPAVVFLLAWAAPAAAQLVGDESFSRYEAQYGTPVDVSIYDLSQNPESYMGRAVRVRGRVELGDGDSRSRVLRDMTSTAAVAIVPVPELSAEFDSESTRVLGREVEVTGVFQRLSALNAGRLSGVIQFWNFTGPPEEKRGKVEKAETLTLETLVSRPGRHDGRRVRVIGQFRGGNLFGDLPVRSKRNSGDWVVKDDLYAVWVIARKPKGPGFELDPNLKRDTGKWLEVVGQVETRGGVTYLRAESVTLGARPSPTAEAQPPAPPPERPKRPPVIVFSLPLDGEDGIPVNERFVVQFSKDMDEDSFKGKVRLRYAGAPRPGDRDFEAVTLTYDLGRRALHVDPGDRLRPGRVIELLLLAGITDTDGLPLVPRNKQAGDGVVDVLRWRSGL